MGMKAAQPEVVPGRWRPLVPVVQASVLRSLRCSVQAVL